MWKKFLAASAVASGIIGLLGAGDAFAAVTTDSYAPGQEISLSTNYDVCVQKNGGYDGDLIIADIRGTNYEKQIVFDSFTTNWHCVSVESIPSGSKLKFVTPMGIGDMMYTQSGSNTQHTVTLVLDSATDVDGYLRSYGMTATKIAKTMATISFDANGGEGVVPAIADVEVGSNVNLPKSTLIRTGYVFAGWNTEADGSGIAYADEATLSSVAVGETQLFAQWNPMAMLDNGHTLSRKLKIMANPENASTITYQSVNTNIKAVKMANTLPNGFDITDANSIVSAEESISPAPIYAWFDNSDNDNDGTGDGVIYMYSDNDTIFAAYDMYSAFNNMQSLVDISEMADWDTSLTTSISMIFENANSLSDISALANWNTSNVDSMTAAFWGTAITNVDALRTEQHTGNDYVSWDISGVESIAQMFYRATALNDISALASWDTSDVKNMSGLFKVTSISDISAITAWNTSNVENISEMFCGTAITNVNALRTEQHTGNNYISWDTSKIENMSMVFWGATSLTDVSALASWNTSKVEEMQYLFAGATALANISALAYWDTAAVKNMACMFQGATSIVDITAVSTWNTSSVTNMSFMFDRVKITNTDALETKQYTGKNYVSWNVSSVTNMDGMFWGATTLANVSALSTWSVSSGTSMTDMFSYVSARPLPSWYHE